MTKITECDLQADVQGVNYGRGGLREANGTIGLFSITDLHCSLGFA
jgi:hypothetical protein